MRKNDAQIGKPSILYKDAKSNIEALSGIESGATAYATGTKELGCYDGTQWVWVSPSDIDNFDVQGGTGTLVFPASGAYTLTIPATMQLREILTANRNYYVRTDGDDSHTGLVNSAAGAFFTIQKAVDTIANTLDIAGKTVTVQVGDGMYTGTVNLRNVVGYAAPGNLVIQGNSGTPANVVISVTNNYCIMADSISTVWDIKDMKLTTATGVFACLYTQSGATIRFGNINFGSCSQSHIYSRNGCIQCIANYSISGGSDYHWLVNNNGFLFIQGFTITLSGTPAFNTFAYAAQGGIALVNSNTYSGSATGRRYFAELNGVIKSEATLPGNTDGSTQTGGQYV